MTKTTFRSQKALQAAAFLLKLSTDRRMTRLRLLKLLYIAEREKIAECALTLTGDRAVGMDHGPVLGAIHDLLNGRGDDAEKWSEFIESRGLCAVLVADPSTSKLTRFDKTKLEAISDRYEDVDETTISLQTRRFREWVGAPQGVDSSCPIDWADVLLAQDRADMIDAFSASNAEEAAIERAFSSLQQ